MEECCLDFIVFLIRDIPFVFSEGCGEGLDIFFQRMKLDVFLTK